MSFCKLSLRLLSLASLLTCLLFSGCNDTSNTPIAQATQKGILLKGNSAEPSSLDPHLATGYPEYHILLALFEGLVTPHPETLEALPGVAYKWDISENGATYTFHLREDAKWSNGEPLIAQDFVFSYERILSAKLASDNAHMLYVIKNAEAFNQGKTNNFSDVGVHAIDEKTLEIELEQPTPYFLGLLFHWAWYPVHPATILEHGSMLERGTPWTKPGNIVSNGPFVLESWELANVIKVTKNPTYWNHTQNRLSAVHFFPISETNTEERAFRSGQLHITEALPISKYEEYEQKESAYLTISPALGTYCYTFNTTKAPFNDKRVRQALNLALDRNALAKYVIKGGKLPAYNFTPANTDGYSSKALIEENIKKAHTLLAEAGFPEGQGFSKFELLYNTSDNQRIVAEAVQAMWQENLGIEVELVNQEWKVFLGTRRAKDFDLVRGNWMGDYLDAHTFLEVYTSNQPNNHSAWSNQDYDALIAKAASTLDKQKRHELYNQAEAILMEEQPLIPIHFFNGVNLKHTDLKGWYPNMLNIHPYQYMFLEPSS